MNENIEWKAPEYEFREKSPDWFWAVGIISVALIFLSVIFKNFLLAVLILVGGFSLILYSAKKPNIVSFSLTPRGIKIGNKIYDYENLKCFWLNYNPPTRKELLIESKKTFMPHVAIILGGQNPNEIRNYLLRFMKEEKIEESLITSIAKLIGF